MADKTEGLTAAEAQALFPGQNINKICRAYTAPSGTARVLYDVIKPDKPAPAAQGETEQLEGAKVKARPRKGA